MKMSSAFQSTETANTRSKIANSCVGVKLFIFYEEEWTSPNENKMSPRWREPVLLAMDAFS